MTVAPDRTPKNEAFAVPHQPQRSEASSSSPTKTTTTTTAMAQQAWRLASTVVASTLLVSAMRSGWGSNLHTPLSSSVPSQYTHHSPHTQQRIHHHRRSLHHDDEDDASIAPPQTHIRPYLLWDPADIPATLRKWAEHYPTLLQLTTSQEAYGLPTAGGPEDCPFDTAATIGNGDKDGHGCANYIATIQDFAVHPDGSPSAARLPHVLWSGAVHGNERVGPTSVLEATGLLLEAAACEAKPDATLRNSGEHAAYQAEVQAAVACRRDLHAHGVNDAHRQWLARLVSTRRLVVVPTANALGYFRKVREENHTDPNRDFAYDTDPNKCMRTIAGRTLNEVFREHMVQLALTFHAGMEVVGYEWGAPSYMKDTSPDDVAQADVAQAYSRYAGGWNTTRPYDTGAMNDLVYPVQGGMEDWAYAGSWDIHATTCTPNTYGGYPEEKTTYDDSTLRAFNMLVETSGRKTPPDNDLGTSQDILTNTDVGNGHVARNIRLALTSLELVQPYATIQMINDLDLPDDVVPLKERCEVAPRVTVPLDQRSVTVQWSVGGALTVDETSLYYMRLDTSTGTTVSPDLQNWLCGIGQPSAKLQAQLLPVPVDAVTSGTTWLSDKGAEPALYQATLTLDDWQPGETDTVVVVARAKVDQDWGAKLDVVGPDVPPQSHFVNARTNPAWKHQHAGAILEGRTEWFSTPVAVTMAKLEVTDADKNVVARTVETYPRYDDTVSNAAMTTASPATLEPSLAPVVVVVVDKSMNDSEETESMNGAGEAPEDTESNDLDAAASSSKGETSTFVKTLDEDAEWSLAAIALVASVAALLVVGGGGAYWNRNMRESRRDRLRDFIDDPNAVTPGMKEIVEVEEQMMGRSGKSGGYSDLGPNDDYDDEPKSEVEMGSFA